MYAADRRHAHCGQYLLAARWWSLSLRVCTCHSGAALPAHLQHLNMHIIARDVCLGVTYGCHFRRLEVDPQYLCFYDHTIYIELKHINRSLCSPAASHLCSHRQHSKAGRGQHSWSPGWRCHKWPQRSSEALCFLHRPLVCMLHSHKRPERLVLSPVKSPLLLNAGQTTHRGSGILTVGCCDDSQTQCQR